MHALDLSLVPEPERAVPHLRLVPPLPDSTEALAGPSAVPHHLRIFLPGQAGYGTERMGDQRDIRLLATHEVALGRCSHCRRPIVRYSSQKAAHFCETDDPAIRGWYVYQL